MVWMDSWTGDPLLCFPQKCRTPCNKANSTTQSIPTQLAQPHLQMHQPWFLVQQPSFEWMMYWRMWRFHHAENSTPVCPTTMHNISCRQIWFRQKQHQELPTNTLSDSLICMTRQQKKWDVASVPAILQYPAKVVAKERLEHAGNRKKWSLSTTTRRASRKARSGSNNYWYFWQEQECP